MLSTPSWLKAIGRGIARLWASDSLKNVFAGTAIVVSIYSFTHADNKAQNALDQNAEQNVLIANLQRESLELQRQSVGIQTRVTDNAGVLLSVLPAFVVLGDGADSGTIIEMDRGETTEGAPLIYPTASMVAPNTDLRLALEISNAGDRDVQIAEVGVNVDRGFYQSDMPRVLCYETLTDYTNIPCPPVLKPGELTVWEVPLTTDLMTVIQPEWRNGVEVMVDKGGYGQESFLTNLVIPPWFVGR